MEAAEIRVHPFFTGCARREDAASVRHSTFADKVIQFGPTCT